MDSPSFLIYAGVNGFSKAVQTIYVGDENNTAKSVAAIYVGDEENKARCVDTGQKGAK